MTSIRFTGDHNQQVVLKFRKDGEHHIIVNWASQSEIIRKFNGDEDESGPTSTELMSFQIEYIQDLDSFYADYKKKALVARDPWGEEIWTNAARKYWTESWCVSPDGVYLAVVMNFEVNIFTRLGQIYHTRYSHDISFATCIKFTMDSVPNQ